MSFILISCSWWISFQGWKGAIVIAVGVGIDFVALGSKFVSGLASDVVMGAVLVGHVGRVGPFCKILEFAIMQENPS